MPQRISFETVKIQFETISGTLIRAIQEVIVSKDENRTTLGKLRDSVEKSRQIDSARNYIEGVRGPSRHNESVFQTRTTPDPRDD